MMKGKYRLGYRSQDLIMGQGDSGGGFRLSVKLFRHLNFLKYAG
jgi:hypothetical protein